MYNNQYQLGKMNTARQRQLESFAARCAPSQVQHLPWTVVRVGGKLIHHEEKKLVNRSDYQYSASLQQADVAHYCYC